MLIFKFKRSKWKVTTKGANILAIRIMVLLKRKPRTFQMLNTITATQPIMRIS